MNQNILREWVKHCNGELTKIEEHGDEDNDSEPDVELDREVNNGNDDVNEGRNDGEDDVVEKAVDRGRAAIHNTQNFARLTRQKIIQNWIVIRHWQ